MKSILFKPWKQKAIRESPLDREWQTRRVIKPQPQVSSLPEFHGDFSVCGHDYKPRYHVGEVVYIKEAWNAMLIFDNLKPSELEKTTAIGFADTDWDLLTGCGYDKGKLRSPMFLRECHARYFIQITAVRTERLQEITLADCWDEGIRTVPAYNRIDDYSRLWDSIDKEHPWASNPFVFVYTFKRVARTEG